MSIRQIGALDSIDNLLATDKLITQQQNSAHAIPINLALTLLGNIELSGLDTRANTLIGAINELYATARGVTGVWLGTQDDYDAISEKDQNTVYIIQILGSIVTRVYYGYTKIYPTDSDFDYIITNQEFFSDRLIDTGIAPFSTANVNRSWMIEADIEPVSNTYDSRGAAYGMGGRNSIDGMGNGWDVYLYPSYSSTKAYVSLARCTWGTSPESGIFEIPRQHRIYHSGDNWALYDWDDNLIANYTFAKSTERNILIGGGLYSNDSDFAYFYGKVNKFGFKWL